MTPAIHKYPRTLHIAGSRLQPGDEDLAAAPFAEVAGRFLVIEEKLDGANAALSFAAAGELLLQSRGHYLLGGHREKHFGLFKTWANAHQHRLRDRLGARYVMYGEWLYAKHTIFYDQLPHYFMEFDVLDRDNGCFLSTARRRELLDDLPLVSVPVLHTGALYEHAGLGQMVGRSLYKSDSWWERLADHARALGVDSQRILEETDPSELAEGLYVKVEEQGVVQARYKFVRASFLTSVVESGSHWLARPIVPNVLADDVDLFAGA